MGTKSCYPGANLLLDSTDLLSPGGPRKSAGFVAGSAPSSQRQTTPVGHDHGFHLSMKRYLLPSLIKAESSCPVQNLILICVPDTPIDLDRRLCLSAWPATRNHPSVPCVHKGSGVLHSSQSTAARDARAPRASRGLAPCSAGGRWILWESFRPRRPTPALCLGAPCGVGALHGTRRGCRGEEKRGW